MHRLAQVTAARAQSCYNKGLSNPDQDTYPFRKQGIVCLGVRCQQQWTVSLKSIYIYLFIFIETPSVGENNQYTTIASMLVGYFWL